MWNFNYKNCCFNSYYVRILAESTWINSGFTNCFGPTQPRNGARILIANPTWPGTWPELNKTHPNPTKLPACSAKNEIAGHFNVDAKINLEVNLNANQMSIYRFKINAIFIPDFSANFANLNLNSIVNLIVNLNRYLLKSS